MDNMSNENELLKQIIDSKEMLLIQDIDGVCIPLVKDPLQRKIDGSYVQAVASLNHEFAVLTNGEHEGVRGVNRLVENAVGSSKLASEKGMYLPGLAAGGIEYQNKFGEVICPGVSEAEIKFLELLPRKMEELLSKSLSKLLPMSKVDNIKYLAKSAILDTRLSPTINLNRIFSLNSRDIELQRRIQIAIHEIMNELLLHACKEGLSDSFYLHIAPNHGSKKGKELIKPSKSGDVGTTDIQFMISGAKKEAGLLVLVNKYIHNKTGKSPLGEKFNVRNAPKSLEALISLCIEKISKSDMPLLIGIGDTVTSNKSDTGNDFLRGGSDRGFLTLIQELGKVYNKPNKIVLVDSSGGEVDRPNLSDPLLSGISDPEDPLKFNTFFKGGPGDYVDWFKLLSKKRNVLKSDLE